MLAFFCVEKAAHFALYGGANGVILCLQLFPYCLRITSDISRTISCGKIRKLDSIVCGLQYHIRFYLLPWLSSHFSEYFGDMSFLFL